jgi:hypothetical protein
MMIQIRRNLNVALAGLAVSALLAGAEKTIVINEGDDVYKATFDDTKAPEARMREWVLLSPYVGNPPHSDENFYMATEFRRENGVEKIDKDFYAPPLEMCREPGCGSRPVDSAWLANAEKNLDLGQKQVQRLDAMTLPAVLEPVRSYLLAYLRFSLDLERARFRYIKDGDVQPLRELVAATCRSSKPEDASMFADLAAASQTARPAASGHGWHNRMIGCRASEGSYPIASWQAFVRNYGVKETKVDSQ